MPPKRTSKKSRGPRRYNPPADREGPVFRRKNEKGALVGAASAKYIKNMAGRDFHMSATIPRILTKEGERFLHELMATADVLRQVDKRTTIMPRHVAGALADMGLQHYGSEKPRKPTKSKGGSAPKRGKKKGRKKAAKKKPSALRDTLAPLMTRHTIDGQEYDVLNLVEESDTDSVVTQPMGDYEMP
jgi:histone H3/H4